MLIIWGVIGFLTLIILALYVFRVFSTPYLEVFRFAFYLFLFLLALTVGFALVDHQYGGYDPSVLVR